MIGRGEKTVDFTQGGIARALVLFSIPIVAGELLQNLYNSVDALIVGNFVSKTALAAVTVSGVVSNMVVNFFNGMSVGTNVVISRAFGEGEEEHLRSKIRVTFTFSVLLGVAISVLGCLLVPQLLQIAGVQPDYYREALLYLRIYFAGLLFMVIYNSGAGILRAIGDSGTPFRVLVISCILNIVLDLLLVAVFRFGVAGAAIATVVAQGVSVVMIYRAINRAKELRAFDLHELRSRGAQTIPQVLRVGVSAGVQSALIGFSNLFVVRYMNLFDTAAVAGIGIAQRLDKFIVLPAKAFGITMTTYVSQNLGAKHYERVRRGKERCLLLALGVTISLSALIYLFTNQVVSIFNRDAMVVETGAAMMHILVPLFWLMSIREVYLGILRGYGKNLMPMLLSLVGMVGVRQIFLAVTMRATQRIEYIYWCYPVAWLATMLLLVAYYLLVRRSLTGLNGREEEH